MNSRYLTRGFWTCGNSKVDSDCIWGPPFASGNGDSVELVERFAGEMACAEMKALPATGLDSASCESCLEGERIEHVKRVCKRVDRKGRGQA
jgi:hypothetical protein